MSLHVTLFGEKNFPFEYFVGHKHMAVCLVANENLYCIVFSIFLSGHLRQV